jgi:LPPG:FO 2-phospho-L-lactate transferase
VRITALSGGIGGARFLRGLLQAVSPDDEVTVIGNTADDIWLFGLKISPDLDTIMYTLGGGIDDERGWGRDDEGWRAREELAAYGAQPTWFGLGDRDLATHVVRTQLLTAGQSLSEVTQALCRRWDVGVRLLPMSDDPIETHIVIDDPEVASGQRVVHFQEYWVGMRASVPVRGVVVVGQAQATPAPGVVEALLDADVVLVPPSNPIVSIGTITGVEGIGAALRTTQAPVVGVSPIIGRHAVRGMAEQLLAGLGIEISAAGVAAHHGARPAGILDGWLVEESDADQVPLIAELGISARAVPLLMTDETTTCAMACTALDLAAGLRA